MKIRSLCNLVLIAITFAACTTAPPSIPVGRKVSGHFTIYEKQIPLPPGEWTVRGASTRISPTDAGKYITQPFLSLALLNPNGNPSAIYVVTNRGVGSGGGYVTSKQCDRSDMHLRVTASNVPGSDQECWWINHIQMGTGPKTPPALRQAYDYAKTNKIVSAVYSLQVGYRLADAYGIIWIRYYFNPEREGFDPPRHAEWLASDWHQDRIGKDLKKVEYVERLIRWGHGWLPKVRAGFKGKLGK